MQCCLLGCLEEFLSLGWTYLLERDSELRRRGTDGAASAMLNSFEHCRVVTEEDEVNVWKLSQLGACAIAQALILLDKFCNKTIKYLEVSKIIPNFAA